jgi:2-polyprenyl-3-methyl-5-hydroxy-6-metoxy-1,4-benzoquinol methylase
MQSEPGRPNPERIFTTLSAHERAAALAAAIELDLFTAIGEGATTTADLAGRVGAAERGVRILADFLVVDGFLTKADGRYGLAPESAAFLDRRSPAYLGTMAGFIGAPGVARRFERLADAVRRGGAEPDAAEGSLAPSDPMWVAFARSMVPMVRPVAEMIAEIVGPVSRALDIAAGHGMFGIVLARMNPKVHVTAVDWKNVLAVAEEHARAAGVADRFHTIPGSAFDVPFGEGFDLVLLPNFLHHFDPPTCEKILAKARAALAPGGRVVLVGIPDGDRTVFSASLARRKGLSLLLSRRMRSSHLARAATLVSDRRVDLGGLVGERHPLAAGGPAWEALVSRRTLKVVVDPREVAP